MTPKLARQIESLAARWHDAAYWAKHGIDSSDLAAELADVLMKLRAGDEHAATVAWYRGLRSVERTGPFCGTTFHVHPIGSPTCICGQQRTVTPSTDAIVTGQEP